jgi:hypothetical protein
MCECVTPGQCSCAFAGGAGSASRYNEEAFHYFLGVERARAARCGKAVLLVLVTVSQSGRRGDAMDPGTARRLFDRVEATIREVDFTGWYREGRIVGAVLAQGAQTAGLSRLVAARVTRSLAAVLASGQASRLRVRVRQVPSRGRA